MILIVGLGNPGKEYQFSRHNAGFLILDYILGKVDWNKSSKGNCLFHKNTLDKKVVGYIKPMTSMNNSGSSVRYAQLKHKIKSKDIVVIYDDLDLALGTIKISFNKNSGGHRGLESIIKKLKSKEFIRIRVGISPLTTSGKLRKPINEEAKVVKFILGNLKKAELETLKKLSKIIAKAIEIIILEGPQKAMSVYNK